MNWTQLLKLELDNTYRSTEKLLERVDPDCLGWKPPMGPNWMTVGQLVKHITDACGAPCKGFVRGDWGLPPGVKLEDIPPEEMLPPAEKLPAIESLEEAKKILARDKALALEMIEEAGEEDLDRKKVAPPWAPGQQQPLGWQLLQMIQHLDRHKAQLFYYLKMQGQPVNTADLWGA